MEKIIETQVATLEAALKELNEAIKAAREATPPVEVPAHVLIMRGGMMTSVANGKVAIAALLATPKPGEGGTPAAKTTKPTAAAN